MYTVRRLTVEDRSDFRAMRLLALTVDPDHFMITAGEEKQVPRLSIEAALEEPSKNNFFLGAYQGAELAGIAGLITNSFLKTRHCGHLTSVFVHPEHRRRGIARGLVDQILADAAGAGLEAVRLEVVADHPQAVKLYESLGFVIYGREPRAYRLGDKAWDLLLMTRDLGSR